MNELQAIQAMMDKAKEKTMSKPSATTLNKALSGEKKSAEKKSAEKNFPWDGPDTQWIKKNSRADFGVFRTEYKGSNLLTIREFSVGLDRDSGEVTRYATKKGITISEERAGELLSALGAIINKEI